jgi:hypothetical protein
MADIAPVWPFRYDASSLARDTVTVPPYDVIVSELRGELGMRHRQRPSKDCTS